MSKGAETITFDTYPPLMLNYESEEENPDYDDTVAVFTVNKDWAINWITQYCETSLENFMDTYIWDETFDMYCAASSDGVIISEGIEKRYC